MYEDLRTDKVREGYDAFSGRYDQAMAFLERAFLRRCRERMLSRAYGRVLDVGVGTGLNFPHYPSGVQVTAIDLSPRMLEVAAQRAQAMALSVNLHVMDVQALDLPDDSFDTVVSSLVFCAVPDPAKGLQEVMRVCRPGGTILMLEHVRSCKWCLGWFMDRANALTVRLFSEHINRDTGEALRQAGALHVREEECFLDIFRLLSANKPPEVRSLLGT